jgi:hypothetical protein
VSEKSRPERRRATRAATGKPMTRPAAPRRPAARPSRPMARSRGPGFVDYLIIALLIVLAVMLVAGLLLVLRIL